MLRLLPRPPLRPSSRPFSTPPSSSARVEEVRAAAADRLQGRARFYKSVSTAPLSASAPSVQSPIPAGVDLSPSGARASTAELTPERLASLAPSSFPSAPFHTVLLDGRALKTPAKNELALPSLALAHAVAHEWDYQASHVEPSAMPLMVLCSTALDQVATDGGYVRENVMRYLGNDTACYHAGTDERVLRKKQLAAWGPLLDWAEGRLGARPAVVEGGLVFGALAHPAALVETARTLVDSYDVWQLTALQAVTMESKSLLVGLGCVEGFLGAEAAVAASRVEEEFQLEQWGLVEGGHDMDRLNNDVQIRAAFVMRDLLELQ
ncbi:hypothetical protein TeGR_g2197 [Tetraparma gracilis]|uniref:Uncharacterized protein n=1 Tax=Tetraparma gracilis TaxID=2962635 RepID=A0ABQ6N9Z0_9STRA|nr:hypothetical protein TeGR_g2197 [Tetraparma gracilis]